MRPVLSVPAGAGLLRRCAVTVVVMVAVLLGDLPAAPASFGTTTGSDSTPVTWSVSPSDAAGPDGRSWVELELDPGAGVDEHFAVRNLSDRDVTFSLTAADGYFTPTGRFNMLPADKTSVGAGTWISMKNAVTVVAGGTAVVPFTVTVPGSAPPGDHAAGIAASIHSEGAHDGTRVGVESRIGFRVMTRVKGDAKPGLGIHAGSTYKTSWNPFEAGSAEVVVDLENTGNVRLAVDASLMANGTRSTAAGADEVRSLELLPGDRRTVRIRVRDVWPLGVMALPLTVTQGITAPGGALQELDPVSQSVMLYAIPWPQLAILTALLLLFAGIFRGRRRRKKELVRLIEEAREAGRREVETL